MFLKKRAMRPVEAGTFCRIPHDIKTIMKGTKSYEREGNISGYSYHDKQHIADTDILYVIDDKAFDKPGLMRVTPVTFDYDGYWMESTCKCIKDKKTFLVDIAKLNIVSDLKSERSIQDSQDRKLKYVIEQINNQYNLHSRNIPIKWEDN